MFWSDFNLALTNQGLRHPAQQLLSSLIHPRKQYNRFQEDRQAKIRILFFSIISRFMGEAK